MITILREENVLNHLQQAIYLTFYIIYRHHHATTKVHEASN